MNKEDKYFVIYCPDLERKYLRVTYDMDNRTLIMKGYSTMTDWKDATLFNTYEEAEKVMRENKPGPNIRGNLTVVEITVIQREV